MTEAADTLKIEVSIRITRKVGYDIQDVAVAKIEDSAVWPVASALAAITDDVTERATRQLRAEAKRLAALETEVEAF